MRISRAVYAKPMGHPLVDTVVTEVSQYTLIHFPWDIGPAFQPPISRGRLTRFRDRSGCGMNRKVTWTWRDRQTRQLQI